jgi:NitT/TauT family transport system substrate-binding protein
VQPGGRLIRDEGRLPDGEMSMREVRCSPPVRRAFCFAAVALALALGLAACAPATPSAPAAPSGATAPQAVPATAKPAAGEPAPTSAAKPEAAPAQKITLKSAFTSTTATFGPIWAAKEGGFFDEEGLDVSLSRIQAGAPILAAMRGGDVPIASVGAQQIVEADLKGGDYVILAGYVDRLTQSIFVNPSIEQPEQLRGKALGITNFGAITHVAGRVGVEQLGLKDQVTFIATGGPPETVAAMQAGTVAGGVFSPPDSFKARELGFRELLDVAATGLKSQSSTVVSTRKWAQENPDLVERYIRATLKGAHRLKTDKDFGMKALAKYSGIEDPKVLEETYNYYRDLWGIDGFPSLPGIQQNMDVAAEEIPEARNAKPEQFVDLIYVEKIKASGLLEKLWGKS